MKISVLVALLASCEAVHQEGSKQLLVGTKAKLSDKAKVAVKNAQKNMQKNKNKKLVGIKDKVECAAMDPMLL